MPGMSIHCVDASRGFAAQGLEVEVFAVSPVRRLLARGRITERGLLDAAAIAERLDSGEFEVLFRVAEYYRASATPLPATPFLEIACFRFGIDDPDQHYHLPFKFTPFGYSLFRGI